MSEAGVERRLTTILAADVVGYSRLMAADEAGTLASLKALRRELIEPKTVEYHGRVVKLMGDGTLMEFGSVVDAVTFAVDVQRMMAERNAGVPDDRRIAYRIGINIGDIIVEGDDIYGDGVNVAARLEGLAEPGGIRVSRTVFNHVQGKVDFGFDDLGEQVVKNIPEPVRVFKVLLDAPAAEHTAVPTPAKRSLRWPLAAAGLVALVIVAGLALWQRPWEPREEPASVEAMAFPLPDRPSIAVLPFTNMSDDPNQDYFADGMTEDLITDLSKLSGLFVIARNSSFSYRGRQVKVRQVAEELGVRYVLEGSVRRVGDQVRINAQLIDATTGGHLWAERYDGTMDDVFDLQDQVTEQIVAALAVKLTADEEERHSQAARANPEAYDTLLRGLERLRRYTRETNAEARELFEKAIALDPTYARAYADLAQTFELDARNGWADNRDKALRRASELIQSAVELDDSVPQVHFVRSSIYRAQRRYGEALAASRKSIELDPNYADGHVSLASVLMSAGRPEEGLAAIRKAFRRNPRYSFQYLRLLGQAYFLLGRYQAAIPELQRVVDANPEFLTGHLLLAAAYSQAGQIEEAEWEAEEVLTLLPDFSLAAERERATFVNPGLDRYIEGLRKAGLPE